MHEGSPTQPMAWVDEVLTKPEEATTERPEAMSLKKLAQGNGSWCT